jgi:hypothetical protein
MFESAERLSETAISAAFRAAGLTDRERMQAAVIAASGTKSPTTALWNKMRNDRQLAKIAMEILIVSVTGVLQSEKVKVKKHREQTSSEFRNAREEKVLAEAVRIAGVTKKRIYQSLMFSEKTSDGRVWADIGYHELAGMNRDGAMARAILGHVAQPVNQFIQMRDLLDGSKFDELYKTSRELAQAAVAPTLRNAQ